MYPQVLLNLYVRPEVPVTSYLTPLTGLTKEKLESQGQLLGQSISLLKATLPKTAILVGQNIGQDVGWLGLKEGTDFTSMMDLAGMYRVWNEQYNTWSIFGQDHVAKVLLGWEAQEGGAEHDAVTDAVKSIRLFNYHQTLQATPGAMEQAQRALLAAPVAPSFAKRYPTFDGVSCWMGGAGWLGGSPAAAHCLRLMSCGVLLLLPAGVYGQPKTVQLWGCLPLRMLSRKLRKMMTLRPSDPLPV